MKREKHKNLGRKQRKNQWNVLHMERGQLQKLRHFSLNFRENGIWGNFW